MLVSEFVLHQKLVFQVQLRKVKTTSVSIPPTVSAAANVSGTALTMQDIMKMTMKTLSKTCTVKRERYPFLSILLSE